MNTLIHIITETGLIPDLVLLIGLLVVLSILLKEGTR